MRKYLITVLLFLCSFITQAYELRSVENSPTALQGLHAIALKITGFSNDFVRYGLETSALSNTVKKMLVDNGLDIVSIDQANRLPDAAVLELRLYANRTEYGYYSYYLALKLRENLTLPRSQAIVPIVSWMDGENGIFMMHQPVILKDKTRSVVNRFLQEYHNQNP